jgi:tellurite resistance protein TerC
MLNSTDTSLVVLGSHYSRLLVSLEHGLNYAAEVSLERDDNYHLFRSQDATAWLVFSGVFLVLILFDNFVVFRKNQAMSMLTASLYTLFWIAMAFAFCGYIYFRNGSASAFSWMSGYLLEWMLSFDNLFVFHLIFQTYATPDHLKHKPLYLGICGAVFFRLIFLFIGEYLLHTMFLAHFLFGGFLVYTGIQTAIGDDEDDDPSQNPIVQFLSRKMPFVPAYDTKGAFFVHVPVNARNQPALPSIPEDAAEETGTQSSDTQPSQGYGSVDFTALRAHRSPNQRYQWRATMLLLVVVCLEISDVLFAVDSVSAVVAQVPDLFLAYTSAVFAMLGLRATFFIIDELVKLFTLLKYGVAVVLIFIGFKLMASKAIHIPPSIVLTILVGAIGASIVCSIVSEKLMRMSGQVPEIKGSPKLASKSPKGSPTSASKSPDLASKQA